MQMIIMNNQFIHSKRVFILTADVKLVIITRLQSCRPPQLCMGPVVRSCIYPVCSHVLVNYF